MTPDNIKTLTSEGWHAMLDAKGERIENSFECGLSKNEFFVNQINAPLDELEDES